jgi:hypothetical protein
VHVRAAFTAAALSGIPSTACAVAAGSDPLEASLAAGALVLPDEESAGRLLVAATVAHLALSMGWTQVLAALLPRRPGRRRAVLTGAAFGLGVAALDLGLAHAVGSGRTRRVAALPLGPQVADHVAFGVIAGLGIAAGR